MAIAPFPVDPYLTGIAIAYKNAKFIADAIAPILPVSKQIFQWDEYALAERFAIPDTRVGRMSQPNQVTFTSTRKEASTEDFSLDSPIPRADIENADDGQDPRGYAAEGIMELLKLDRERRLANLVFNPATYAVGSKETLAAADQWSNTTSDPKAKILDLLDAPFIRPNCMVIGRQGWTKLRQHPKIVESIVATGAREGVTTAAAVAELLELDEIIIGEAWYNAAKPGQNASMSRLWGKHALLFYKNPLARVKGGTMPTFMITARWGQPVSGSIEDPDMGMRGGVRVRAGESCKELLVSPLCGYFLENVVA